MKLDMRIDDPAWRSVPDLRQLTKRALEAAVPEPGAQVSVLFTGDEAMQALNLQWRDQDKSTNVLSFPAPAIPLAPGQPRPLGDIVLAHGTVSAEALAQGKTLSHHAAHLLVHGMLHLLGSAHDSDLQADAMEAREIAILESLGIGNPYAA